MASIAKIVSVMRDQISYVGWVCQFCNYQRQQPPKEACPQCHARLEEDPLVGKVLKQTYRLERRLAQGGMGAVYEARHIVLRSLRAVKIFHKCWLQDSTARHRFLREVRVTHQLSRQNPHIVEISDTFGFDQGIAFYAMELLEGHTLEDRIERDREAFPLDEAKEIALQICDAMQCVHDAHCIHRDLKPSNIFIVQKAGKDFVKIVDFGIAKPLVETGEHLTKGLVGTPAYLAPDQVFLKAGEELDGRSDIYSLGVILFEMFTGHLPFFHEHVFGLINKQITEAPPPPSSYRRELPPALDELLLKMLCKERERRFCSMAEVAAALRDIELSHSHATGEGLAYEPTMSLPDGDPSLLSRRHSRGGQGEPRPKTWHPTPKTVDAPASKPSPRSLVILPEEALPASAPRPAPTSAPKSPATRTPQLAATRTPQSPARGKLAETVALPPESRSQGEAGPEVALPGARRPLLKLVAPLGLVALGLALGMGIFWFAQGRRAPKKLPGEQAARRAKARAVQAARKGQLQPGDSRPSTSSSPRPQRHTRTRPRPRLRPRPRSRRLRRRPRYHRIPYSLPRRHFLRSLSRRSILEIRKGVLLLRKGSTARLRLLRASTHAFQFFPCTFTLTRRTRRLRLRALVSTREFKPSSPSYCTR